MAGIIGLLTAAAKIIDSVGEGRSFIGNIAKSSNNDVIVQSNGDMTKLVSKFVVTPTIIVSKELKDTEIVHKALAMNVDLFASFYTQVFNLLTGVAGNDVLVTVDLLSNAGKSKGVLDSFGKAINFVGKNYINTLHSISKESYNPTIDLKINLENYVKNDSTFDIVSTENNNNEEVGSISEKKEGFYYGNLIKEIEVIVSASSDTAKAETPNHSTINHKIVIPITIKADVIFLDSEYIENILEPRSESKDLWNRWMEWRAGGISFWDMIACGDLIQDYKQRRLKDKENILAKILANKNAAYSKKYRNGSNGLRGYSEYYNMLVLSSTDREKIERKLSDKLKNDNIKNKFLQALGAMSLNTLDLDYEKSILQIKDIDGSSIIPFKNLRKNKKDEGEDLTEIVKALLVGRPPVFA